MSNSEKTKQLVEGAVMVALAAALSFVKVFQMPWGGSITAVSMLPIIVYSLRHGAKKGFFVAFVYSLFQFAMGAADGLFSWGLTPVSLIGCIFFDYIGAFTVIGFSGFFHDKGIKGCIAGTVTAGVLRFICHFLSGAIIWHSFGELWQGFVTENPWLYSFVYNGAYMLPEIIFTAIGAVILFKVPQTKKLVAN